MQCQTPFFLCRLFVTFFGLWSSLTVQAQLSTNLPGWNNPRNYDQFTYQDSRSTRTVGDSGITSTSYPPDQWINVQCPNEESCVRVYHGIIMICYRKRFVRLTLIVYHSSFVVSQLGWHEQYEESVGWELEVNSCVWCPKGQSSGKSQCRQHHQSPIDLLRSRAIEKNNPDYNECIDGHWMAYVDSSCSFEELERLNAFHIERHALQVIQPIEPMPDDAPDIQDQNGYRNACQYNPTTNTRNRFGKIDFPKGFSQWWHLSHIDLHVPSEHTQEGKRYDGELQMYHIYSVTAREAGVDNEMGVVSVFIQSYDDSADYPLLNRIICQWRKAEERTREQCGLPSVESQYPGCYPYHRTFGTNGTAPESTVHETMAANPEGSRRTLLRSRTQHDATQPYTQKPLSMHDIVLENDFKRQQHEQQLLHNASYSEPFRPKIVHLTSENEDEVKRMEEDIDWDAFVKDIYQREEEAQANNGTHRHLLDYQHVGPFHNYWPLIDSRTEYYFRYSGTQTVPVRGYLSGRVQYFFSFGHSLTIDFPFFCSALLWTVYTW